MQSHDAETHLARHRSPDWARSSWQDRLLLAVDIGIALVVLVAPLAMGGRHPVGKLALIALVAVTCTVWLTRQAILLQARWRYSGAEWLITLALLLVGFQIVPLPASVLDTLSPRISQLLPVWQASSPQGSRIGVWNQISLTPSSTRGGLVLLATHAAFFLLLVQRINGLKDVKRLLRLLAISAVSMAVIGLLQLTLGNGKFLWMYQHPSRTTLHVVKGTFANQNHFAHFLALGLGPLLWWLQSKMAPSSKSESKGKFGVVVSHSADMPRLLLFGAVGLVGLAAILTISRGGLVAIFLVSLVCLLLFGRRRPLSKKAYAAFAAISVVVAVGVSIYGSDQLSARLGAVQEARSLADLSEARHELWLSLAKIIPDFLITGTGVGSHAEVYRLHMDESHNVEFTHAESGYLQVLIETGVVGFMAMLFTLVLCFSWCLNTLRRAKHSEVWMCASAVTAGLTVSVAHSLCDFVWYIPACMSATIILAAIACRLHQLTMEKENAPLLSRTTWSAAAVVLALIGSFGIKDRLPAADASRHWDAYLHMSLESNDNIGRAADQIDQDDVDPMSPEVIRRMLVRLHKTVEADPNHARAQMRIAAITLRQFDVLQQDSENAMDLVQIRDAAISSQFSSREQQEQWLKRALGKNRMLLDQALSHAWRGLRLSPLQGQGYVYLAELSFLVTPRQEMKTALLQQAERVRPHFPTVLMALGREAVFQNEMETGVAYWKRAFAQGAEPQRLIISSLAPVLPAQFFIQEMEPDIGALWLLYREYRRRSRAGDTRVVAIALSEQLEALAVDANGIEKGKYWNQCQSVLRQANMVDESAVAAEKAWNADPDNYNYVRTLAIRLVESEQYSKAATHVRWCLRQRPRDKKMGHMNELIRRVEQGTLRLTQNPQVSTEQ